MLNLNSVNMTGLQEYSYWLFDQYVEAVQSHDPDLRNKAYASVLYEALQKHLDLNLQGKVGYARRSAKSLLRDIKNNRKDPAKFPIEYIGPDQLARKERQERLWKVELEKWEALEDERICNLSNFTDPKSLKLVAKIVIAFEEFRSLHMTSMDDACLCGAANLLLRILDANGYKMDHGSLADKVR